MLIHPTQTNYCPVLSAQCKILLTYFNNMMIPGGEDYMDSIHLQDKGPWACCQIMWSVSFHFCPAKQLSIWLVLDWCSSGKYFQLAPAALVQCSTSLEAHRSKVLTKGRRWGRVRMCIHNKSCSFFLAGLIWLQGAEAKRMVSLRKSLNCWRSFLFFH